MRTLPKEMLQTQIEKLFIRELWSLIFTIISNCCRKLFAIFIQLIVCAFCKESFFLWREEMSGRKAPLLYLLVECWEINSIWVSKCGRRLQMFSLCDILTTMWPIFKLKVKTIYENCKYLQLLRFTVAWGKDDRSSRVASAIKILTISSVDVEL